MMKAILKAHINKAGYRTPKIKEELNIDAGNLLTNNHTSFKRNIKQKCLQKSKTNLKQKLNLDQNWYKLFRRKERLENCEQT